MTFKKGDRVKHKVYGFTGKVDKVENDYFELEGVIDCTFDDKYYDSSYFEKIEVPKVPIWFHEAYKFTRSYSVSEAKAKEDMLYYISRCGYGHHFHVDNAVFEDGKDRDEHTEYVNEYKIDLIRAILEGYEVEQEPLYEVVLFKNGDGRRMLVRFSESHYTVKWDVEYFGQWQQKLTKDEIEEASELHGVDYMKIAKRVGRGVAE
ncbi:DUF1642 domain-containing protein [Listeria kieliensis]